MLRSTKPEVKKMASKVPMKAQPSLLAKCKPQTSVTEFNSTVISKQDENFKKSSTTGPCNQRQAIDDFAKNSTEKRADEKRVPTKNLPKSPID